MSELPGDEMIHAEALYTKEEFFRRLKITEATLRSARRRGFRVCKSHGRVFISGRDWIDYVHGQVDDISGEESDQN